MTRGSLRARRIQRRTQGVAAFRRVAGIVVVHEHDHLGLRRCMPQGLRDAKQVRRPIYDNPVPGPGDLLDASAIPDQSHVAVWLPSHCDMCSPAVRDASLSFNWGSGVSICLCRHVLSGYTGSNKRGTPNQMDTTRVSLLLRLKANADSRVWLEFTAIYRPILMRYARACGLDAHDAEDIAQECLAQVHQSIGRFEYDKRRGGFKRWLRVMVKRRVINRLRKRGECQAESGVFRRPQERESLPEDEFEKIWLDEHVRHCLGKLRDEVEPQTCEAYQRLALDDWSVEKVCQTYGITANNAYVIKSRLTARLRELMAELIGESE